MNRTMLPANVVRFRRDKTRRPEPRRHTTSASIRASDGNWRCAFSDCQGEHVPAGARSTSGATSVGGVDKQRRTTPQVSTSPLTN